MAGATGVGYDANRYEAPILIAVPSVEEAAALAESPDAVTMEPDGEVSAPPEEGVDIEPMATVEDSVPEGGPAIGAREGWGASRGAQVGVALVDSGIYYKHPDLESNYRGGVSLVENELDPMDLTGQGTHCAGIIAASGRPGGISGVAPAVDLLSVRILGVGAGAWSWLMAA